jgi:Leucine rich repeat/Leucine Rich repeats (2 copies)
MNALQQFNAIIHYRDPQGAVQRRLSQASETVRQVARAIGNQPIQGVPQGDGFQLQLKDKTLFIDRVTLEAIRAIDAEFLLQQANNTKDPVQLGNIVDEIENLSEGGPVPYTAITNAVTARRDVMAWRAQAIARLDEIPGRPEQMAQYSRAVYTAAIEREARARLGEDVGEFSFKVDEENWGEDDSVSHYHPVVWELTHLTELRIAHAHAEISIDPRIGQMTRLNYLEIWTINAVGGIPEELGNLTELRELSLSGRFAEGDNYPFNTFPPIGNMTHLRELSLQNNGIEEIPEGIFNNLTELREVDLLNNAFHAFPPELANLPNATHLYLGWNPIGAIPVEISQMIGLVHLDVSHCGLQDIPPIVAHLPHLEELNVQNNNIVDLPDAFEHSNLRRLTGIPQARAEEILARAAEFRAGDGDLDR